MVQTAIIRKGGKWRRSISIGFAALMVVRIVTVLSVYVIVSVGLPVTWTD